MSLVIIALVVFQIFTISVAVYLYGLTKKKDSADVQPYSQFYIGLFALGFAIFIVFLFYAFVSDGFEISNNLGQVGDFVGGLTNPVLSFIALIVLLRTTLIQTNEARKTSLIMLQQQLLMEEERFESTFYKLLERYENSAETNLRWRAPKDKLTFGLRILQDARKRRAEFNCLSLRMQVKEVRSHISAVFNKDKIIKTMARAWKVYRFLDGAKLPDARKKYYFSIMVDAMEPCELIIFLSSTFAVKNKSKGLKKYLPGKSIRKEFFPAGVLYNYYCGLSLSSKVEY